ncbi:uncharacterized protein LOC120624473 [Pararge aegeria]|uniref:Jg1766 protein n=2 Tax=Pararge aegeria TaxID=116150 RepID=A0A8S4RRT7_9NEOP|nr:uncharacterized protein LOC120624473 [Pararge aegeria]CAH2240201.1 jg1766 [Pararge aegeria aegeria]CAH2240202.1 jg1766 [Pararge aegeria aegeria]
MEADSTTYESNPKSQNNEIYLPFSTSPGNLNLLKEFISNEGGRNLESQLVGRLQSFGLLPTNITCPTNGSDCKVICKSARVIDRVQWVCEGCSKRLPIRTGSFFFKLQCSILQTLQLILAWCEDTDTMAAAQYFDVKPRVAISIYDKLDSLAINELKKSKLGGENAVVLSEIYPDCLNRLSPDTTDQPHVHRILMIADTKHIPTHYRLHVIQDDLKKPQSNYDQSLSKEIEQVLSTETEAQSMLVMGNNVPIDGTVPLQQLTQHCDTDMQHFLTSRIWSQALTLCSASRDFCAGTPTHVCANTVQKYLDTSLYRLRYGDGFYDHILRIISNEFTQNGLTS